MTDALRILEVQGETVDLDYLSKWAADLGVDDLLRQLRQTASGGGTDQEIMDQ